MKKLLISLIPSAALAALFMLLRGQKSVMRVAARSVGAAWRRIVGAVTSVLPFSLMEVGGTILAILALVFVALLIAALIKKRGRQRAAKRCVALLVVAAYGGTVFLWCWCSTYFAPPVYEGVLTRREVSTEELKLAAEYFRDGANALSGAVRRDEDGGYDEDIGEMLALSGDIFDTVTELFPALSKSSVRPKKMIYSELMSRTGYTGIYLGLTGEANVNVNMPRLMLPSTIAHELAHSRGVGAEDAANFFGVAACITSGTLVYEYSGYLSGLIYIQNVLVTADYEAYLEVLDGYSDVVRRDLAENSRYWAEIRERNERSPVMTGVSNAVNANYDVYLKANAQQKGLDTYGECVDLLTVWVLETVG